jgi:hypothetical protein
MTNHVVLVWYCVGELERMWVDDGMVWEDGGTAWEDGGTPSFFSKHEDLCQSHTRSRRRKDA